MTAPVLLVLTGSADETADYLCSRLFERERPVIRFDTDAPPPSPRVSYDANGPTLELGPASLRPGDVGHIWFRRPKPLRLPGAPAADPYEQDHIEREWAAALEGFLAHVPIERWMNHPARNARASHKLEQLTRAATYGLAVPRTLVTQDARRLRAFWETCDGALIAKPLASGYIERLDEHDDTAIYTTEVSEEHVAEAAGLDRCPTLFQQRVEKVLDVRLTVVDDALVAVGLEAADAGLQRLDIRRDNMADVRYSSVEVPVDVGARVRRLVRSYGLRFAALDFAVAPDGDWVFFEVNPNGQWAWLDLVGAADLASVFDHAFFRREP